MIIDRQCHIHGKRFDQDRHETIERARQAGVGRMIVIGSGKDLDDCAAAIEVAESHHDIWATVGIHPHDVKNCDQNTYDAIRSYADRERVVAIGETGLDYYYDHSPKEAQRIAFRRFIALAKESKLPLVMHIRDAHEEAIQVLREENASEVGGVIHCFTGTSDDARAYLDLGFHLGITGIVTFKRAGDLPEVVGFSPMARLLVETDSPYLAPHPHRGKRNEPAFVPRVVDAIAAIRDLTPEEVAAQTTYNANLLFSLPPVATSGESLKTT